MRGWKISEPGGCRPFSKKVVEEISFDAPTYKGTRVVIDTDLVTERIGEIQPDEDLSEYIL